MKSTKPYSPNLVKIGDAAKIIGVSIDTIRRWETKGKIIPIKTPGGTRLYSLKVLESFNPEAKQHLPVDYPKPRQNSRPQKLQDPINQQTNIASANTSKPFEEIILEPKTPFFQYSLPSSLFPESLKDKFRREDNNLRLTESIMEAESAANQLSPKLEQVFSNPLMDNTPAWTTTRYTKLLRLTSVYSAYSALTLGTLFGAVTFVVALAYLVLPVSSSDQLLKSAYLKPFKSAASALVTIASPGKAEDLGFVKSIPHSQLTEEQLNVLAVSSIAQENKYLQLNADTNVIGNIAVEGQGIFIEDLTAPNIIYGLIAGAGISVSPGQTPTISSTDSLASVTSRGATTSTPVTFEGELTLGAILKIAQLTSDPASPTNGSIYYNTTTNIFRCYQNGSWRDCDTDTTGTSSSGDITAVNVGNGLAGGASSGDATIDLDVTTTGTTTTTSTNSGLETSSTGLSMLRGCSNGEVLSWDSGTSVWECTSVSGIISGDITAVGSMTSGDVFADATADDDWLGLGALAGRIEFDDQATDEVNILSANVGIGTATPGSLLEVGNGTDSVQFSGVGDITFVDADGAASITGSAGGTFSIFSGAAQALTMDSATDINLDADGADVILLDGGVEFGRFTNNGTALEINSAGTLILADTTINLSGGTTTFQVSGTGELTLSSTALAPSVDSGLDLGTGASQFADLYLDGQNINLDNATDIDVDTNTAAVLTISAGADNLLSFDSRASTSGVTALTVTGIAPTFAGAAGAEYTTLGVTGPTITMSSTTQVTSLMETVTIVGSTITNSAGAQVVDKASALSIVAPIDGANVTLTDSSALRILNETSGAGTLTNQYGIYVENLTAGASDYGVYVAGADTYAIFVDSGDVRFDGNLSVQGTTIGLNDDASANNVINFGAGPGQPTGDLYWGNRLLCTAASANCGWAAAGGSSPFTSAGGIIDKTTIADRLRLQYGDAGDVQFEIENTTNAVVPTADVVQLNLTGGAGVTTDNVDGVYINIEAANGTSTDVAGVHIDFDPITGSSDDTFSGLLVDAITGTAAVEYALNIGDGWDSQIFFNDTTSSIGLVDAATLTIEDAAGNDLVTITDGGATGDLISTNTLSAYGTSLGLNNDASVNNVISFGAGPGQPTGDLYWGSRLLCTAASSNCGWATSGVSSPFTSAGGVIDKVAVADRLRLLYGDAGDVALEIQNTTNSVVPTADAMQINLAGGTGITTDGVDGLYINIEGTDGTTNTVTALHLNFDTDSTAPPTGDETFVGLDIDALNTATAASEYGIRIGNTWDANIYLNDTTANLMIPDTGSLTFEDNAGNDIFVLADVSTANNHVLTGDADTGLVLSGITTITASSLATFTTAATLSMASTTTLNCGDCIDFDDLKDSLTLDASTSIGFGAGALNLTFTNDGSGNEIHNLTSTGDFIVQDNSTTFFTLKDDSTTDWVLPAAGDVAIDASTTASTVTTGVFDLNVNAGDAVVIGSNIDFIQNNGAAAGRDAVAAQINLTANDADGDVFGLKISGAATANAGTGSYEAGITIDNAEDTAASMTDAILITSSGVNNGVTDALDVSAANINNAINLGANFALFDGVRVFEGSTGVLTIEDTSGNDLVTITDGGTTGDLVATNTLSAYGTSIGLNNDASVNNVISFGAGPGQPTGDLYWGSRLLCTAASVNCGWASSAASPFTSTGGIIDKTTAADRLRLLYGDPGDVQLEINNTTNTAGAPTADVVQLNLTDGAGVTTDNVDGIYINIEGANGTSTDLSAIHIDFDPITGSSDDTFSGLLVDAITGTAAVEYALNIGDGWDSQIFFNDTTSSIGLVDAATLTIEDAAGNDILVLADVSTASNHVLTGDANTGLVLSAMTTDLSTGTDENLTVAPNGTGDLVVDTDADTQLILNGGGDGVDSLVLTDGDILVSDGDFDLSAGDFNVALDAGDSASISKAAASSATAALAISNTTAAADTAGSLGASVSHTITNYADDGAADTHVGFDVLVTQNASDAGTNDITYGIRLQNLGGSPQANNEYGIYQAGTSWDYGIYAEDLVGIDNDLRFIGAQTIDTTTSNLSLQPAGSGTTANVQIGAGGAGSTTPDFLALDVKSDTGDPAGGAEGYMYYNTSDNKFRCYQDAGWTDCVGTSSSPTLQDAYNNDANGSNATIELSANDDSIVINNAADADLTDSAFVLFLNQAGTTAATSALDITQVSNAFDAVNLTANSIDTENALDIAANGLTTGTALNISSTGTIATTGELVALTANSLTSGAVIRISATGLTSGTGIEYTGSSATGITGNVISLTSDVGSAGELINLAPDFSGSAVTGYGIDLVGTDSTGNANIDYGYYSTLTLTGNAAKNAYGVSSTITSNSTTADILYGGYFNVTQSGANSSGTDSVYGLHSIVSTTGTTTGGTSNAYGLYTKVGGTLTTGGTLNTYGVYVDNDTTNTTGTTNKYGLYANGLTGADNNYGIYIDMGTGTGTEYGAFLRHNSAANGTTGTLQLDRNNATVEGSSIVFSRQGNIQFQLDNDNGEDGSQNFSLWDNDNNRFGWYYDSVGLAVYGSAAAEELDVTGQIQFDLDGGAGDGTIGVCKSVADSAGVESNVEFVDCSGTPGDIAEAYPAAEELLPGEVVSLVYINGTTKLVRTTSAYDNNIIGVVSTFPVGQFGKPLSYGLYQTEDSPTPVGLSGRLPVKVSLENGLIQIGDALTSSSIPGVAMRADKYSKIIGFAIEPYDGSTKITSGVRRQEEERTKGLMKFNSNPIDPTEPGVGKILFNANNTFINPQNFFASLSFDADGTLIVPKLKVDKLTIAQNNLQETNLSTDGNGILASVGQTDSSQNSTVSYIDLSGKIASFEERLATAESRVESLESSQTANIPTPNPSDLPSLPNLPTEPSASDSAELNLTPPEVLLASSSANLTDINLSGNLSAEGLIKTLDLTVSGIFKSLGETILGTTTIAGDLIVDGTMSLNGSSVNSLGTLYLQNNPLSLALDIFNGKIKIDNTGKVVATTVSASEFEGQSGQNLGSGKILAGTTLIEIPTPQVKENSRILITPTSLTSKILVVSSKVAGDKFIVSITDPSTADITFDWLIINEAVQE